MEIIGKKSIIRATELFWISSLLSLPNATQYAPTLCVDQELAFIAAHVTPLSLRMIKQKSSRVGKKATKVMKITSAASTLPDAFADEPLLFTAEMAGAKALSTANTKTGAISEASVKVYP